MVYRKWPFLTIVITISEVQKLVDSCQLHELPDVIPPEVYDKLIHRFVSEWEDVCLDWFIDVKEWATSFIVWLCKEHFSARSGLFQGDVKFPLSYS